MRMFKRPDFSPSQPRRLLHPPALSLLRHTLHPGTRRSAGKAAASDQNMILPSLLVYIVPGMARMSPPLRASNEGLLRPRVARAQGDSPSHPFPAGGLFQQPANLRLLAWQTAVSSR